MGNATANGPGNGTANGPGSTAANGNGNGNGAATAKRRPFLTTIGMRPTMRQLEYLAALDTHGHVGRAAAACFVTQPTLSAQIRELEKHVGVTVTERVGRGIAVTAAGRELAARARVILREADELLESAHRSATELTGPLRVAAIPTVAPYLLARVLPALRERHPSVEVHLLELQTAPLTAALVAAELDLGLMALPIDDARFDYEVILVDPFLLAMAPDHRLAHQSHVAMRGIREETVLLLEDGHCMRDQTLEICDRAGVRSGGYIQGTSLHTICQMVAAGMGVTLLPASARQVEAREGTGVVVRPFSDTKPGREVVLVWRKLAPAASLYRDLGRLMAGRLAEAA